MQLNYMVSDREFYRDKDIRDGYVWEPESRFPLIRFHSMDDLPWLQAVCTTRRGGVSTGHLAELNLGFQRGDVPANVSMNYRRVTERMGAEFSRLALTQQVHGTELKYVEEALTVGERFERKITCVDGLYTDRPGIVLSGTFADCVPILLADPVGRQIAAVHSGWRGTVGEIGRAAVEALQDRGADPKRMTAVIGPCISGNHYEVTGEVIEALSGRFPEDAMRDIARRTDDIHWLCDLPAACWYTLHGAGIPGDRIHFSGFCTWENAQELFSHRRSGGKRGNFNTFIRIL